MSLEASNRQCPTNDCGRELVVDMVINTADDDKYSCIIHHHPHPHHYIPIITMLITTLFIIIIIMIYSTYGDILRRVGASKGLNRETICVINSQYQYNRDYIIVTNPFHLLLYLFELQQQLHSRPDRYMDR